MRLRSSILVAILCFSLPAWGADLLVLTEYNPPFSYEENEQVTGTCAKIFHEMAQIAGIAVKPKDIELWPWARAYRELQTAPNVILFPTARTEARENLFQWIGPIFDFDCALVSLKENRVIINDIKEDSNKYAIGTIRDTAPEQRLIALGVDPDRLQRVHDLALNIKKLADGRIDTLLFNEPAIMYTIKELGLNTDAYEVSHVLFSVSLYYAASKDMSPETISKLQSALDQMKESGRVEEIMSGFR